MKKIVITVGAGFTAGGMKLSERDLTLAREKAQAHLLRMYGGFTLTHGQGGWLDNDGVKVIEPVDIYTIYIRDAVKSPETEAHLTAARICRLYAQQAVVLESAANLWFIGENGAV